MIFVKESEVEGKRVLIKQSEEDFVRDLKKCHILMTWSRKSVISRIMDRKGLQYIVVLGVYPMSMSPNKGNSFYCPVDGVDVDYTQYYDDVLLYDGTDNPQKDILSISCLCRCSPYDPPLKALDSLNLRYLKDYDVAVCVRGAIVYCSEGSFESYVYFTKNTVHTYSGSISRIVSYNYWVYKGLVRVSEFEYKKNKDDSLMSIVMGMLNNDSHGNQSSQGSYVDYSFSEFLEFMNREYGKPRFVSGWLTWVESKSNYIHDLQEAEPYGWESGLCAELACEEYEKFYSKDLTFLSVDDYVLLYMSAYEVYDLHTCIQEVYYETKYPTLLSDIRVGDNGELVLLNTLEDIRWERRSTRYIPKTNIDNSTSSEEVGGDSSCPYATDLLI